jgi:hypothetical protein
MAEEKNKPCKCPYCDTEIKEKENAEECSFCKVKISLCSSCGYPVSSHIDKCPNCGNSL